MTFLWYLTTTKRKRCKSKSCKRKRLTPIPDRLSALPDSILCHILSFLPTKHSAATSILSKRWNSLWLSVFTLDLVAKNSSDTETFDRVILLRDIKVPIQTLRLKCNVRFNVSDDLIPHGCNRISSLISAATQRGLETLELDMQSSPVVLDLASNIFNFKTLTVLKLRRVTIQNGDLTGINTSLKTLHLDDVFFRCNTDIINFLLSFPTLEELQTDVFLVEKIIPQKLCLPNLKKASIGESRFIPFFLLSKALILNITLTFFMIKHTQVPTFHNLTQIELYFKYDCKRNWKWMLEMLQHCPKLQHLIVEKNISYDDENNWREPNVVPECLSSQLRTCLIRNCRGRTCELQFAEYVMRNSKVLRTMTINKLKKINSSGYIDNLIAKYEVSEILSRCPRSCDLIFD